MVVVDVVVDGVDVDVAVGDTAVAGGVISD